MASDSQPLEPPDRELLARAAAGDAGAFGLVYQHYQHVVYRFGFQMTASRDAAEDITQEVFVTLFRDLGRYNPSRATCRPVPRLLSCRMPLRFRAKSREPLHRHGRVRREHASATRTSARFARRMERRQTRCSWSGCDCRGRL